jgi:hypothetical protein
MHEYAEAANGCSTTKSRRSPMRKKRAAETAALRAAVLLALAGLVSILAAGCGASKGGSRPSDLDYSTTRTSKNGTFKVVIAPSADPIPLNRIHAWQVHVEDSSGQPVTEAAITVEGGMPEHGHGLPTKPMVTQNLGTGTYLVEGMKFQMHGWWTVTFTISAAGKSDTVTFNLRL